LYPVLTVDVPVRGQTKLTFDLTFGSSFLVTVSPMDHRDF
jgi:hypothetical protein